MISIELVYIGFTLFLGNGILLAIYTFRQKDCSIRLSIWPKLLVLQFNVLISSILIFQIISGTFKITDLKPVIYLFGFAYYTTYATFAFRYEIKNEEFQWFNGLKIIKIKPNELKRIEITKKKKKNPKISFILENDIKTMRDYLGVVDIIKRYGKLVRRPVMEVK